MGGEGQQGVRQRLANACHLEVMEECTSLLRPNFKLILGEHKLVLCRFMTCSIIPLKVPTFPITSLVHTV